MGTINTNKGLDLIASLQAQGKTLTIDKFIFANIPGLDPGKDPDPNEDKPSTDKIVYQCAPFKVGYVSPNCVAYSAVLGPDLGDFDFNWVGLWCSQYSTLMVISYNPLTHKQKNSQFDIGNTISKNIGIQYMNIKDLTAITIKAETWQLDFYNRFAGIDDRERRSNWDMYGNKFFEDNAFLIINNIGKYTAQPGLGYVRGIQIVNQAIKDIGDPGVLPKIVYIDTWMEGDYRGCEAKWQITTSATALIDYKDSANQQHYIELLATIAANSAITDNRNDDTTGNYRKIPRTPLSDNFELNDSKIAASTVATKNLADRRVKNDGTVGLTNLITNGDFSKWTNGTTPDGLTITRGTVSKSSTTKIGSTSCSFFGDTTGGLATFNLVTTEFPLSYWQGRTITMGCWIKSVAHGASISVCDGVSTANYASNKLNNNWEFVTNTSTIASNANLVTANVLITIGATALLSGICCYEGSSAFAFSPNPADLAPDLTPYVKTVNTIKPVNGDVTIDVKGIADKEIDAKVPAKVVAYVNFSTDTKNVATIKGQLNVSSVTYFGSSGGNDSYIITFTSALSTDNYAVAGICSPAQGAGNPWFALSNVSAANSLLKTINSVKVIPALIGNSSTGLLTDASVIVII